MHVSEPKDLHALANVSDARQARRLLKLLAEYCDIEPWSADVSKALFELGPLTRRTHGFAFEAPCGLVTLLSAYEPTSRKRIAGIIADAVRTEGHFGYAARMAAPSSNQRIVIMVGETVLNVDASKGRIEGLSLMPRIPLSLFSI